MESGELDQSEAPPFWPHGLASVSVALLVETDTIVYKSRAKQLRRQTISITTHVKKHQVWKPCVIVFPYDPGEWWFTVPNGG